jgi:hypothetical protein
VKTYFAGVDRVGKLDEVPRAGWLVSLVLCYLLGAHIVLFDTDDSNGYCEDGGVRVPDAV